LTVIQQFDKRKNLQYKEKIEIVPGLEIRKYPLPAVCYCHNQITNQALAPFLLSFGDVVIFYQVSNQDLTPCLNKVMSQGAVSGYFFK